MPAIRRPGLCPRCADSGTRPGTTSRRCPGCGGTGQRAVATRHGLLMVRQVITCPECAGRGRVIDQPCPACEASGRVLSEEKVTIRIPPGILEGATLRLAGHGMPSPMAGGPPGDAYASIRTRADPRFARDGADLWHDLHIQAPGPGRNPDDDAGNRSTDRHEHLRDSRLDQPRPLPRGDKSARASPWGQGWQASSLYARPVRHPGRSAPRVGTFAPNARFPSTNAESKPRAHGPFGAASCGVGLARRR